MIEPISMLQVAVVRFMWWQLARIPLYLFALFSVAATGATVIIDGSNGLPVPTSLVTSIVGGAYPGVSLAFEGIAEVSKRMEIEVAGSDSLDDRVWIFTAIPGANGKAAPDYIVRRRNGCGLLSWTPDVHKNDPANHIELNCAIETLTAVRERATCAAGDGTWDALYDETHGFCVPDTREACERRGGIWRRGGIRGNLRCDNRYPDGGKTCSDNSECLGGCQAVRNEPDANGFLRGVCKETNHPFGCFSYLVKGRLVRGNCYD